MIKIHMTRHCLGLNKVIYSAKFTLRIILFYLKEGLTLLFSLVSTRTKEPRQIGREGRASTIFYLDSQLFQLQLVLARLMGFGILSTKRHRIENLYKKFNTELDISIPNGKSYSENLRWLAMEFDEDEIIQRAVLDTYRRTCDIDSFFMIGNVSQEFIRKIQKCISNARRMESYSTIGIVCDASYILNASFTSLMLKNRKRVFTLGPHWPLGEFRFDGFELNRNLFIYEIEELLHNATGTKIDITRRQWWKNKSEIQMEILKRQMGKNWQQRQTKKILFLHCQRDASLITIPPEKISDPNQPLDYIEWTRMCLSIIAEEPKEWIIRFHPESDNYEGDKEISRRLMEEHKGVRFQVDEHTNPYQYISSKDIVFTFMGSVVLECAAAGKKAYCLSGKFNDSMAKVSNSFKDYANYMRQDVGTLYEETSKFARDTASYYLFLESEQFTSQLSMTYKPNKYQQSISGFARKGEIFHNVHTSDSWSLLSKHPCFLEFDNNKYSQNYRIFLESLFAFNFENQSNLV